MVTQVAATAPGVVALHSSGINAVTWTQQTLVSCDAQGLYYKLLFLCCRYKGDFRQLREKCICQTVFVWVRKSKKRRFLFSFCFGRIKMVCDVSIIQARENVILLSATHLQVAW